MQMNRYAYISRRQAIWTMDEQAYDLILNLTRSHLRLAKEGMNPNTNPERKKAIRDEIQRIRDERDMIINNKNNAHEL